MKLWHCDNCKTDFFIKDSNLKKENEALKEKLKSVRNLLLDLKRCGNFFYSAIEIDPYIKNPIDGEEFKKRIDNLIKTEL